MEIGPKYQTQTHGKQVFPGILWRWNTLSLFFSLHSLRVPWTRIIIKTGSRKKKKSWNCCVAENAPTQEIERENCVKKKNVISLSLPLTRFLLSLSHYKSFAQFLINDLGRSPIRISLHSLYISFKQLQTNSFTSHSLVYSIILSYTPSLTHGRQ